MYRILQGDVIEQVRTLADASVDAIVTDPPYGLKFMGKGWDAPWRTDRRQGFKEEIQMPDNPYGRSKVRNGSGRSYGADQRIMQALQGWHFSWAVEALRVLKPGGYLLAFGGSRTYHRLACAIEDAGFEIRDQIMWIYGSGFPKSLNVSKAIDKAAGAERETTAEISSAPNGKLGGYEGARYTQKRETRFGVVQDQPTKTTPTTDAARQWDGWGTALKPAHEPIVVARKPLVGTVAANVLKYRTGAINIDACRIGDFVNTTPPGTDRYNAGNFEQGYRPSAYGREGEASAERRYTTSGGTDFSLLPGPRGGAPQGRWPANVIHDGSEEVLAAFPEAPGQCADIKFDPEERKTQNIYGAMKRGHEPSADRTYQDKGSTSFSLKPGARRLDEGSAARFFYCAKAGREERGEGNSHPTVKPIDLMAYLCRLVTPPGGIVLDLFMGSGSTGIAALRGGFDFVGIELSPAYVEIAKRRIAGDAPLFNQEQKTEVNDELQSPGR